MENAFSCRSSSVAKQHFITSLFTSIFQLLKNCPFPCIVPYRTRTHTHTHSYDSVLVRRRVLYKESIPFFSQTRFRTAITRANSLAKSGTKQNLNKRQIKITNKRATVYAAMFAVDVNVNVGMMSFFLNLLLANAVTHFNYSKVNKNASERLLFLYFCVLFLIGYAHELRLR